MVGGFQKNLIRGLNPRRCFQCIDVLRIVRYIFYMPPMLVHDMHLNLVNFLMRGVIAEQRWVRFPSAISVCFCIPYLSNPLSDAAKQKKRLLWFLENSPTCQNVSFCFLTKPLIMLSKLF